VVRDHRLTITSKDPDPRASSIASACQQLGLGGGPHGSLDGTVGVADVIFLSGDLTGTDLERLERLLVDELLQTGSWSIPAGDLLAFEVAPLPGVTDPTAATVIAAAARLGIAVERATSARRVVFENQQMDPSVAEQIVNRIVTNPVIERCSRGTLEPLALDDAATASVAEVIAVRGCTEDELRELGIERSLALDPHELLVIQDHFAREGRDPTDVELETLAQTWSEHCAHKSFRATISTPEGDRELSLMAALRATTESIDAPFVRSSFVGNAGIISYHEGVTIALKAETHNHPSAVEPFGGANTGVGGVIRDVLGAGHRPIAITDVLCFGSPDLPLDELPEGSLHPRRIRDGVIDGVADYGNKIGLPTVAGAILYDPGYTTNPLVFAGCIGTAPERAATTGPHPGDRVVVLGGRTGRDGIRGATFSSLTMDATTGQVAGASVQIGDPITEKLLIDVLVGAEHLYSAITDCGAGGLSSAIGEMAEEVGAVVDLERAPLKYAGLEPWEIWLSEAQERMVIAVPPDSMPEIQRRCDRSGVELADLGRFTGDGRLVVRYHDHTVLDMDTGFLHDGRPRRRLDARLPEPQRALSSRVVQDPRRAVLELLAHRNIASKAQTIHRYDHEIRGATVVRPLVGPRHDGPADGVVLAEPTDAHGVAIGIGVNPWYGLHDPEAMACAVVDEAIRNVVAVGADPDKVSLLDNFSWGDPLDADTFGALVAAVDGCCAAATAHAAPFVSGKDSLNNTYVTAEGTRHAVPPTLVITAVAHVPEVECCVTPDLTAPGNLLVLLGGTRAEFAGSHLDLIQPESTSAQLTGCVPQPDPAAPERYRHLHGAISAGLVSACHDLAEGGLAVALAEMCIAGRRGAQIHTLPHEDPIVALFAESTGRFVAEVAPVHLEEFLGRFDGEVLEIGTVTEAAALALPGLDPLPLDELTAAFHRDTVPDAHRPDAHRELST
jgi:phosphoribosylformylglycinamidine synthase II